MFRVGCRPIQRKYKKCSLNSETMEDFKKCSDIKLEMTKCYEALYLIYYNTSKENIIK